MSHSRQTRGENTHPLVASRRSTLAPRQGDRRDRSVRGQWRVGRNRRPTPSQFSRGGISRQVPSRLTQTLSWKDRPRPSPQTSRGSQGRRGRDGGHARPAGPGRREASWDSGAPEVHCRGHVNRMGERNCSPGQTRPPHQVTTGARTAAAHRVSHLLCRGIH